MANSRDSDHVFIGNDSESVARLLKGKLKGKGSKDDNYEEDKDAMAFKVLSEEQTKQLISLPVEEMQAKLKEIFKLEHCDIDLREAATLDYYTSGVWWAVEKKFTAQQVSGFFSVLHALFDNVKEKHLSLVENVRELKKMLVGIGMDDVKPAGLGFFEVHHAKLVTDYVYTSFFQHYKLYSYMFSHTQAEEIIGTDLDIEVAKPADLPFPAPLDEGVTEEMYQLYVATPPPTPVPEKGKRRVGSGTQTPKSSSSRKSSARNKRVTIEGKPQSSRSRSSRSSRSAGSRKSSAKSKAMPEEEKPDPTVELEENVAQSDLFSQLTPDDVREVIESVTKEMLGSLQSDVAVRLKEKEISIINKINKVHRVAEL